jgi:VIT1/CCC1 family predicted Fe2+/Mn2+ transporter
VCAAYAECAAWLVVRGASPVMRPVKRLLAVSGRTGGAWYVAYVSRQAQVSNGGSVKRWRSLLSAERDAAALYSRLADAETGERRQIFSELAEIERKHAAHWEDKLRGEGVPIPARGRPSLRTRLLGLAARQLSTSAVLPLIERAERADATTYDNDPDAAPGMAEDERSHSAVISRLIEGSRPGGPKQIGRREPWHRGDRSGALRAGVFGVSDGLVSNTALVMGFAGSGASGRVILLAGVAGLLAGSFSMAAGEYISMASQREMYQREISLEEAELKEKPEEERAELVLIYRAKGLARADAERTADRIMTNRDVALDTLAREELGLDPQALGSPWVSAVSSLLAFAIGAFVVVIPYLAGSGTAALISAIGLAASALFAVGATIGALNGRPVLRSGSRQVFVGALAAGITYLVGHLIGASVS